jgi:hypothetical protein
MPAHSSGLGRCKFFVAAVIVVLLLGVRVEGAHVRVGDADVRVKDARVGVGDAGVRVDGARVRVEGAGLRAQDAGVRVGDAPGLVEGAGKRSERRYFGGSNVRSRDPTPFQRLSELF